jgi:hypothetical protein
VDTTAQQAGKHEAAFRITLVPEPTTALLVAIGLALLAVRWERRFA